MTKIMVIDDTPDTLEATKIILEMKNFKSLTYDKAQIAIDDLKKGEKPDLILLDIRMPDISGPDFCKIIRDDEKLKKLKIVFFTASSDIDKKLLKQTGALGYIFKPFDMDKLEKDVMRYIKK